MSLFHSLLAPQTRTALMALAAAEGTLDAVLSAHTMAPRALDRLDCHPSTVKREGQPHRPLVIVMLNDQPLIVSADAARRLAIRQDARGRQGAAHDLLGAADLAEQLAHTLQRAMN